MKNEERKEAERKGKERKLQQICLVTQLGPVAKMKYTSIPLTVPDAFLLGVLRCNWGQSISFPRIGSSQLAIVYPMYARVECILVMCFSLACLVNLRGVSRATAQAVPLGRFHTSRVKGRQTNKNVSICAVHLWLSPLPGGSFIGCVAHIDAYRITDYICCTIYIGRIASSYFMLVVESDRY